MRALRSDGDHGYNGPSNIDNYNGSGHNPTDGANGNGGEKK